MNAELLKYHNAYADAHDDFKATIDDSYQAVRTVFMSHGWPVGNADLAEELVAAIVKYAVVSRFVG